MLKIETNEGIWQMDREGDKNIRIHYYPFSKNIEYPISYNCVVQGSTIEKIIFSTDNTYIIQFVISGKSYEIDYHADKLSIFKNGLFINELAQNLF